ncbi:MAG: ATP-binding protein [Anaerolineales bacterium]|jgi:signal transduction histidine kinase
MRLSSKLVLAFLSVALVAVLLVAVFAAVSARSEFGRFIFDQYQTAFIDELEAYYSENGTFNGFRVPMGAMMRGAMGPGAGPERRGNPITVADARGVVFIPGDRFMMGEVLPTDVLDNSFPMEVDGETVGYVLASREAFRQSQAEQLLLNRVNRTVLFASLGAAGLALVLGLLLARTLTQPIRELTSATEAVAQGHLEQQVPVRSGDELGELARSFNQMSQDLAKAQSLRQQMTADIAHELRTPLSVILSHVDAIEEGVLPPTPETLHVIREETAQLSRLVEDLRTLSRADAGELSLNRLPTDPNELLSKTAASHRPLAAEKSIGMELDIEDDLPQIEVDPDRIGQVLDNLLNNALRHTPEGGTIRIFAHEAGDGLELGVVDSGPGIAPEALPHVFERFYRADSARGRDQGGTGLGLAIARSIVESHGGRIRAESVPEQGATFIVWLPSQYR